MRKIAILILMFSMGVLFACTNTDDTPDDNDERERQRITDETDIDAFLEGMSLEEKVGQMLQAEQKHITKDEVKEYNIGSILSGGGSHPVTHTDDVDTWYDMVKTFQDGALEASSGIPLIYGVDAVHGHNNVYGATMFPHNINLGMANDEGLMEEIGEATTREMKTTGIHWNFSPAVSVVEDIRWGRTYEGFSEDVGIHRNLVAPYIEGLQSGDAVATAKHFIADGATEGGIDQGNVVLSEEDIRERHLPPYLDAIDAGVDSIMISFSSIDGEKMHGSHYWITEVLKDELGFEGIVLSDWNAIMQLDGSFDEQLVTSINAGLDMLMLPENWKDAHESIIDAVDDGDIDETRIDDAVSRILKVKLDNNLFEDPYHRLEPSENFATDEHKALAREAAAKSFVLLENEGVLPLSGDEDIHLSGPAHDNLGYLSGGWTIFWQGYENRYYGTGHTIFEAMKRRTEEESGSVVDRADDADTVIVVFNEVPYTEGQGDTDDPSLFGPLAHPDNEAAYDEALEAKEDGKTVIGVVASGRPVVLEDKEDTFDALVAIFLPGSEGGNALADVLYGDTPFSGKLSFAWPKNTAYFDDKSEENILYPFGYGLRYED
ncbi:MAG: glycoside hydrolase family 3 protein [Bacillota bacterium]